LIVFALICFRYLPRWLPGRPPGVATAADLGVLAAVVASHHELSRALYARRTTLVATAAACTCWTGFPSAPHTPR
jgi:hypothetical protein